MWWMAVALATTPIWDGNDGRLWGSRASDLETVLVESATGTVIVSDDRIERVTPDGMVEIGPADWIETNARSAPGCDLDGDGSDEVADVSTGGVVKFRDLTGAILLQPTPDATATRGRVDEILCADIDADGALDIVGFFRGGSDIALWVWDTSGALQHVIPVPRESTYLSLSVGQMDADPALELVMPNREIMDGSTWTVEATLDPTLTAVSLVDIDADGIEEQLQGRGTDWSIPGSPVQFSDAKAAIAGDFDGDGTVQVVYDIDAPYDVHWTTHHILDVSTGVERHPPVRGRSCTGGWQRHDHDGDGVVQLVCRANNANQVVYDPATGQQVLYKGNGSISFEPLAGDVDGDGDQEVLWVPRYGAFADRIVLREADGTWLDMMPTTGDGRLGSLVDIDGDGDAEIVVGHEAWDWSAAAGFTALPDLFPPTNANRVMVGIGDFNLDGSTQVLFKGYDSDFNTYLLNLATGQELDLGNVQNPMLWDVDGDGTREILAVSRVGLNILDGSGSLLAIQPNYHRHTIVNGQLYVLLGSGDQMDIARWNGRRLVTVHHIDLPWQYHQFLAFRDGRMWFRVIEEAHAITPNGTVQEVRTTGDWTGIVVDDYVWNGGNDLATMQRM